MGWPNEATHWGSTFVLTEKEKIRLGIIKKPEPLEGKIHVVIPEHYGAKGVIWVSRFINENQLDAFIAENPNLQILDPDVRRRYQPEPEEEEDDEEPEVIEEDGDAPAVDYDDDFSERWEKYR